MAIPTVWRTKKQRYSLEAAVCPICSTTMFPPRKQCLHCSHNSQLTKIAKKNDPYTYFMIFDLAPAVEATVAGDD
jgi:uncharacterized OB-fold protein